MEYVIETNALTKKYGVKPAVNQMSIRVKKGDIYGLIGKNGAGKTTLMKLLLGLSTPDAGQIALFGSADLDTARQRIGSLIEAPALYKKETAFENMKRFAILTATPDEEIRQLLALVGLQDTGSKKAGVFSLGMKQRLGIAIALLGNPDILILDEPTNGLDPAGIKEIRDLILALNARGVTFLISSHLLDELGKIATNYGIVSNGVLVEEISASALKEKCKTNLTITVDDASRAKEVLSQCFGQMQLESDGGYLRVLSPVEDASLINEALVKNGIKVYELRAQSVDLEEFFIERMG